MQAEEPAEGAKQSEKGQQATAPAMNVIADAKEPKTQTNKRKDAGFVS